MRNKELESLDQPSFSDYTFSFYVEDLVLPDKELIFYATALKSLRSDTRSASSRTRRGYDGVWLWFVLPFEFFNLSVFWKPLFLAKCFNVSVFQLINLSTFDALRLTSHASPLTNRNINKK